MKPSEDQDSLLGRVAIIGMAGRFPGARDVGEFWRNQLKGVESISRFSVEELEIPNKHDLIRNAQFVSARAVLDDADLFDADFFGMYPREAELTDPQHRLFLECCWQALEEGGYVPSSYPGLIGVFGGCSPITYFLTQLCRRPDFMDNFTSNYQVGNYTETVGNIQDCLATRVSYKLNLRGPSFTLLSACSTSLVAVTQASQSLLTYQSDMALAGGASVTFPQKRGSQYQEGGMTSPDGHCRTFDANAKGTVFGCGVGVVLLKRLEDALRDRDQIHAVIRGFAVNNDGASKVGYTAPSVEGQAAVIALAQEMAGIDPESVGYIEAHGTGTPLGDPIELAALTQAFRARTDRKGFCAVGSVKTNLGHLDIAAGVTGLIHATHIVRHAILPPTLHFQAPNPRFDLDNSPFYVNTQARQWDAGSTPRRAGVSAFGVGGTNAHVVIEEPPAHASKPSTRPAELLVISARSAEALDRATDNLAELLAAQPATSLADAAWTLQVGRRAFPCRRALAARDVTAATAALSEANRKRLVKRLKPIENPRVVFLFPGQGSQHPNMARELYQSEPVFRKALDHCSDILKAWLDEDLRVLLYPPDDRSPDVHKRVTETVVAQPAIFSIEYALAQLWMSWGIQPEAMLGHSVGEFVAACLADVISLDDALRLVAARGRMMHSVPPGGMLSIRLPGPDVQKRLDSDLSIAAVNSPSLCVVSGPFEALERLEQELGTEGVMCRRLVTSHAFHSAMMDPILAPLTALFAKTELRPPRIPFISGVSGTWIRTEEATDPRYWAHHARGPVQFSRGVAELRLNPERILLEVGPGNVLSTLARQHEGESDSQLIVASLSDGHSGQGDATAIMNALGTLWVAGVHPDWAAVHAGEERHRISLPTYPFERKRYWCGAPAGQATSMSTPPVATLAPEPVQADITVTEELKPMSEATAPAAPAQPDRRPRIITALSQIFEELSGMDLSGMDPSTTFLEMGFDSLFLTQVTQSLQGQFGVKITFRQLLGDESSLSALAAYLDGRLPADVLAPPVPVPAPSTARSVQSPSPAPQAQPSPVPMASPAIPTPSAVPSELELTASAGAVERLMREQLEAMERLCSRQLDAMRGAPTAPVAGLPVSSLQPYSPGAPPPPPGSPQPAGTAAALPAPADSNAAKEEFKPFGPYKPPQKVQSDSITPSQRTALQELIEEYTKKTPTSKSTTQQNRQVLADPRAVSGFRPAWKEITYPIITVRSKGSRLWDVDGNEYIDLLNGFGCVMFGHRPDFVAEAIRRQLDEGFEIGPQSPIAGEIAKTFCQITGSERMTFCNTGSEAVMAAIRVARTVTGRNKIALFSGAYHGLTDEVLVKGLTTRTGEHQSIPVAPGIPREKVSNVTVLEYGAPGSLEWIRQNAKSLAAVLVEPVQSRHPGLQPVEFLKEVRRITEDNGTAFIFDEVVTGFRVHPAGCQALFGIKADLATYGKVVAGGMPIGILAGKAEYMDTLDGGSWQFGDDSVPEVGVTFFAGTFVRHPLTLAAVKSVLQHLMEEGPALQDRITEKTARLVKAINTLFAEKSVPSRVETFGSIFYFSFPTEERFAGLFYHFLRLRGVHLREGFPCFITTAHSDEDIDRIFTAFKQSVDDMQRAGFFPAAPVTLGAASGSVTASHDAAQAPREVPVTESQLEVWLSDQLGDDASCGYNESISISMRGVLNEQAISGAIQQVVARHEALRSTFSEDGEFVRFAPALEVKIASKDFSHLDRAQREAQVAQIVHEDAHTPFRLSEGPLVRAQLIRLEPELTLLIFTAHHIVCDGWSTNVLLDDLARLYNAFRAGVPAQLDAPVQFGTYASHQREFIASLQGKQVEQYWLQQFQTPVSPLGLPTDRPRPPVREFKGATHRRKIGAALYSDVRKLGAKHKCTLFVTLLSAFQILMKRLSGQDDIVVGVPMAGQSLLDDAALVGHCVNFIPIRAHVDGTQKVPEFLAQLRQTVLAAYENQNYTYGRLVRKLSLQRDPSRLPLVEVQFNLERVGDGIQFDGLETQIDANPKSFVNFDLFWNVIESSEGLVLDCDYNTGLFDEATIDRWLSHYESLLAEIAANAERPIAEIPLLNENDLRRWMPGWNETATEYPRELCVHELFEAQVKRSPDAVAVQCDQRELTYAELNRRADQLAGYLQGLGVEPGVLVGLFVDRSLEMMVGLLGILKAGAAYVPIDPTFPPERISFVLADAEASVLLTQERLPGEFVNPDARVVFLDRDWELIRQASPLVGTGAASPKDLAYVIYTSGSTGKPKGVEIPHQAFVNLLCSMQRKPGLEPSDVLLAVTTLSFDIAGLELFLPLCVGAKLVIATREDVVDGHKLLSRLRTSGANVIQATPVTFRLLIEAGWEGIPRVKVLCGGEALPRELAGQLGGLSAAVWNMYGPTETTIWSSTVQVQNDEGPVPIGPPIDNTQFYVLDQAGQLTPIGVPGELHIGGDGLARGYFRRPELTAEKFISSPFGANQNTRLYKTGDLVRCLPSGTFEFLGRLDHQVKLRGFRIELGEIETALARYPGVRQAVVTLREDVSGDKRLVAYVTTDQKTFTVTEARDFLNGKLPYYMMPAAIVRMETMPLTPNGKVDRRALPAPEGASPSRAQSYVAPRNEEETALAGIWEEVLRQERISVQDSLFELGADSLHIFQIVARANKAGMKVTPAHLLKHRTIAALSEALKAENALPGTKEAPALVRVAREKYKVKH